MRNVSLLPEPTDLSQKRRKKTFEQHSSAQVKGQSKCSSLQEHSVTLSSTTACRGLDEMTRHQRLTSRLQVRHLQSLDGARPNRAGPSQDCS